MSVETHEGKHGAMRVRHVVRWCWFGPWTVLTWLVAGGRQLLLSARVWVLGILLVIAALVAY